MTERLAYTVKEAAEALGVSEWMVREEIRQHRIYSVKMGARLLIPRRALEERLGLVAETPPPAATS